MSPKQTALMRARRAWGDAVPDWVEVLAVLCDKTSLNSAARKVGYSSTALSQVINGKYTGNLTSVEKIVRGAVMNATVHCPVVGDLALDLCMRHQRRAPSTNPMHLMFFRACRNGCPNSQIEGDDA